MRGLATPVPRPTQSMPELMSIRGNGPGLRVGCTFKASGPETASEDLCARAARLLSEGVEQIEIVLLDAAKLPRLFLDSCFC